MVLERLSVFHTSKAKLAQKEAYTEWLKLCAVHGVRATGGPTAY